MNEKFICPECNRKFPSKRSLAQHKKWHKPGYRENHTGKNHPNYGKFGAENPMFGKRGEESSNWKNDKAGRSAIHRWIRIYYPQKVICDDKCEICGKFNLHLHLAQFTHTNKRNTKNPMIDYLYICSRREKNSCHRIYDNNLSDKEKEELLAGAITREEKLKRVREYVLKIKRR